MKKSKTTTYITLDQERKSIKYLTEKKQEIEHQVEINQVLKKYTIRDIQDIDRMPSNSDKTLLTSDADKHNTSFDFFSYNFYVHSMLPKAPTKLVEIEHKNIKQGKLSKIDILESSSVEEINLLNIAEPRKEQLNNTLYTPSLYINYIKNRSLEHSQVDLYYIGEIYKFIERTKNEYLRNLTKEQVQAHYQSNIDKLNKELETCIYLINNQTQESRWLATPNDLRVATMGTRKDLKWRDIDKQHEDKAKELLKSTAPEILDRLEDDENPDEIISQFIGIKLSKRELRVLKPLRAIIDRAYKLGEIQDYSHKIKIYTSDFYKEYGLKARKEGGYDDNQTHPIREILFNGKSNLTRRIFFNNSKHQKVMITAFILKLEWDNNNNYFEVMLDDIIFVKDKSDKYSYYYENLQGLNRLMELMPKSNAAFELHEYLEYSLKAINHEFGITKLLNASPTLEKRYKKDKNVTIQRLEKILDQMIKAKTLISTWKKVDGKNETKYILTNLHKAEKENNKKAQLIQIKQNR